MPLLQVFILALVQGVTEFLPISSSGHLVVTSAVGGWQDSGPMFDVSVHLGTLLAVMLFFRKDVVQLFAGLGDAARGDFGQRARLSLGIGFATVPVLVAGILVVALSLTEYLRNPIVIAWATIGFAIPLYLFDRWAASHQTSSDLSWRGYGILGLAQALAVIPGTSRAGITMTAGRFLQLNRSEATRMSMLMSIPAILAIGGYAVLDMVGSGNLQVGVDAAIGAGLSFVFAWCAIWGLTTWVRRASFLPFVIYRLVLGGALLLWLA